MGRDAIARAIVHQKGKILVLQNSVDDPKTYARGKWELPGGWVEAHDDHEEAAVKREVREETGLDVAVERELERVRVIRPDQDLENGRSVADCQYYLTRAESRDVTLSGEHQDARWIAPEAFRDMDWLYYAGFSIPVLSRIKDSI